ncbi:hypothetical protein VP01_181g1 [Puccinia sorghi]|uniref:Integrase catalytic domain-containing protein n=1 Tax=Puccinia sorghi TaxID=27349 RepID=A0A0L6VFX2_9BASI|nr:hypothetical protein VP01_181g1 [Puccinia sorghi]
MSSPGSDGSNKSRVKPQAQIHTCGGRQPLGVFSWLPARGEFVGNRLANFFSDNHIQRMISKPYHPEHKGRAKWANQTIMESMRVSIILSGIQKRFWHEILKSCCLSLNQIPCKGQDKLPWEIVHMVALNMMKVKGRKLDSKGEKGTKHVKFLKKSIPASTTSINLESLLNLAPGDKPLPEPAHTQIPEKAAPSNHGEPNSDQEEPTDPEEESEIEKQLFSEIGLSSNHLYNTGSTTITSRTPLNPLLGAVSQSNGNRPLKKRSIPSRFMMYGRIRSKNHQNLCGKKNCLSSELSVHPERDCECSAFGDLEVLTPQKCFPLEFVHRPYLTAPAFASFLRPLAAQPPDPLGTLPVPSCPLQRPPKRISSTQSSSNARLSP